MYDDIISFHVGGGKSMGEKCLPTGWNCGEYDCIQYRNLNPLIDCVWYHVVASRGFVIWINKFEIIL